MLLIIFIPFFFQSAPPEEWLGQTLDDLAAKGIKTQQLSTNSFRIDGRRMNSYFSLDLKNILINVDNDSIINQVSFPIRQLISEDKISEFINTYGEPDQFLKEANMSISKIENVDKKKYREGFIKLESTNLIDNNVLISWNKKSYTLTILRNRFANRTVISYSKLN